MPRVIEILIEEHRNIKTLLHVLEQELKLFDQADQFGRHIRVDVHQNSAIGFQIHVRSQLGQTREFVPVQFQFENKLRFHFAMQRRTCRLFTLQNLDFPHGVVADLFSLLQRRKRPDGTRCQSDPCEGQA